MDHSTCTPTRDITSQNNRLRNQTTLTKSWPYFTFVIRLLRFLLINSLFSKYSFSFSLSPRYSVSTRSSRRGLVRCVPRGQLRFHLWPSGALAFYYWKIIVLGRERASIPRIPLNDAKKIEKHPFDLFQPC